MKNEYISKLFTDKELCQSYLEHQLQSLICKTSKLMDIYKLLGHGKTHNLLFIFDIMRTYGYKINIVLLQKIYHDRATLDNLNCKSLLWMKNQIFDTKWMDNYWKIPLVITLLHHVLYKVLI